MAHMSFGRDAVGIWRDAALSPVSRWITLGVGIAGIIAGTVGSPESACTPLDPCTPLTIDAFGVLLGLGALPGLASVRRRWRAVADRLPPGRAVGTVIVGLGLTVSGALLLPDAIVVAQGGGVSGTLTITSEDCARSCSYSGQFRSTDGTYVFKDVFYAGSGEIGSTWPAVYVGSGEVPEEVYEPGKSALRFSGFLTLAGLGTAAYPFVRRFLDGPRRAGRGR